MRPFEEAKWWPETADLFQVDNSSVKCALDRGPKAVRMRQEPAEGIGVRGS